jgi:Domain of unknown function (DUF4145)
MRCPHCQHHYTVAENIAKLGSDRRGTWYAMSTTCPNPECNLITIRIGPGEFAQNDRRRLGHFEFSPGEETRAYPAVSARPPAPREVPAELAKDYNSASEVLHINSNAAAALSRRTLQAILRDPNAANVSGKKDLSSEIEEFLTRNPPSQVADPLHTLRELGNFAAHPLKDPSTDRIVEVDAEEAEWTLDVVAALFDYFYVQPERTRERRQELNKKRKSVGKKPI